MPRVGPTPNARCPSGAIRLRPGRKIQPVIDAKPEGTTFCFETGTYRLRSALVPKSEDVFVGKRGAVLKGSKVVNDWTKDGSYWRATGQRQEGEVITGVPCKSGIECNRPEGVFIDDKPLLQVSSLSAVRHDRFFFDYPNDTIYMADDPTGHRVEASVSPGAFRTTDSFAKGVVIKNLVIEMFANPSRTGAIWDTTSPGWVIKNNEITLNHGIGIIHQSHARIVRNDINHNGQLGLAGYQSVGALVSRNEIAWNAIGGFAGEEAGGAKYVQTTDLTVRGNYVHDNQHHGLWTDGDNVGTVYENNTVVHNKGSGIFHEISFDCIIRGNRIARNGMDGIFISSSSNVEAYNNIIKGNGTGGVHLFLDEGRGYELANNFIHDNVISMPKGSFTGLTTLNPDPAPYSANNRFQDDAYVVSDVDGRYWAWDGAMQTWNGWQAAGQDTNGSVS